MADIKSHPIGHAHENAEGLPNQRPMVVVPSPKPHSNMVRCACSRKKKSQPVLHLPHHSGSSAVASDSGGGRVCTLRDSPGRSPPTNVETPAREGGLQHTSGRHGYARLQASAPLPFDMTAPEGKKKEKEGWAGRHTYTSDPPCDLLVKKIHS